MTIQAKHDMPEIPRRSFLKASAVTALAAPYFVPATAFGTNAPSNRINVGCIGVGNQGYPNLQRFLKQADCQVLAVCDVNRGSHGYKDPQDLLGREPAKQEVEKYYADKNGRAQYQGCDAYNDFRELLARDDIDAIMLAPPDHWHEPMTIAAAKAGKDIYCEKPLGLTIGGQKKMIAAVRDNKRVLQTGSHERSNPIVRQACELVRSGAIGDVKRVVANVGRHNKTGPGPGWQPMPVPPGFDYELWLGPAPDAPYHEDRCLYNFRFNYDYAGGQVTNFGAHSLDMAQWGLGTDDTGPVQIDYVYADFLPKGSLFTAATHTLFRARYANGTVVECVTSSPDVRCMFEGTEGIVRVDNMGQNFFVAPTKIKPKPVMDVEKYHSGDDHVRNFLDCCKSRGEPTAPVEIGHRSGSVCHLGNIAIRLQAKLKWDPKAEQFTGPRSDEANAMLNRSARGTWEAEQRITFVVMDRQLKKTRAAKSMAGKNTDIRVTGAELYLLPVRTRVPLKFGAETLTSVTCARVRLHVRDRNGRAAVGWGETPLSVQWAWPAELSYAERHEAMIAFSKELVSVWSKFDAIGHPLEVGSAFLQFALPSLRQRFNHGRSVASRMPYLAALVCLSAFDIALHDAYGVLHDVPTYDTYHADWMNHDLSWYLEPADGSNVDFQGKFPQDYFVIPPPSRLAAWHLVGGLDLLDASELNGDPLHDALPVVLGDWIERDGLFCLKIKLRGNDADWDYNRIVRVGRIALDRRVQFLSTDFNCTVTEASYVNNILDRLAKEEPAIHDLILYVEQPFPYELDGHPIDVRSVSMRKPLFMDESAHNWQQVRLGRALGWTGVALKTCKTQTGALLSLCWAKAHGMDVMVQDLTNPMLAQIPHVLLSAYAGTIMGTETNAMQFYPQASVAEAAFHPGLYARFGGHVDLSTISGPGLGYRGAEAARLLPRPAASDGLTAPSLVPPWHADRAVRSPIADAPE